MSAQGNEGLLSPFLKARRLKRIRKYIKGRVFDYGCGTGDLGKFCKRGSYLGFDTDAQSLALAKAKYQDLDFVDQFPLWNGWGEKFNTIVLCAVIEHVDDPASLLTVLEKYLDRDGTIVITTPRPSFRWIHSLGAKLGIFSAEANKEHRALLDKEDINRVALEANLIIVVYERFLLGANQLIVFKSRV
jgi:2-polyprenyl-3-methyl-5-hydroxy-6-metoxy-1,4-benzoquinol methylase